MGNNPQEFSRGFFLRNFPMKLSYEFYLISVKLAITPVNGEQSIITIRERQLLRIVASRNTFGQFDQKLSASNFWSNSPEVDFGCRLYSALLALLKFAIHPSNGYNKENQQHKKGGHL